jgi:hypothetical protein
MQQVAMDSIVWGQTTVVVGDADLTGVTVNLRRAPTMRVRVELPATRRLRQRNYNARHRRFSSCG